MILLDVFEVVVGTYLQLGAGSLVANDDALRMELKGRDGPHLVDRTLHRLLQGTCLVVAFMRAPSLAHSAATSSALPLRMFTFSGLMSIWLKKLFHMNE